MVDLTMTKRIGKPGEVGLFVDSPVWEGEFSNVKNGEVKVEITTPRSLAQLKYAWALAGKIAEACDWLDDKDAAMDFLLIEARHYRRIYDPLRQKAYLRPKPTNFGAMDGTAYTKLLNRMKHVAMTMVVPGIEEASLRDEIEAMICEPEPAAQASSSSERKGRGGRSAKPREPMRSADAKGGDHVSFRSRT